MSHPLAIVHHSGSRCLLRLERGAASAGDRAPKGELRRTQMRTVLQAELPAFQRTNCFHPWGQEEIVEGVAFLLCQEVRLGFGHAEIGRHGMSEVERGQQEQNHRGRKKGD